MKELKSKKANFSGRISHNLRRFIGKMMKAKKTNSIPKFLMAIAVEEGYKPNHKDL